jgi:AraC-like DNA-binding protein
MTVEFWRAGDLCGAELLKGRFEHFVYRPHVHETVCLAVITGGAIEVTTRRGTAVARRGDLVLVNADEVHGGRPAHPSGWRMRTLHAFPSALAKTIDRERLVLRGPVIADGTAARALWGVHWCSERRGSPLKRQSWFTLFTARLARLHGENPPPSVGDVEPVAVRRARDHLEARLANKVTLDELAIETGLSPFRLLRAFNRATGMPPHAYQTQARIRAAAALLRRGDAIADVAAATGFADQAHLTRVFRRFLGVTPGKFRAG